jgi:hypothetical protein
VSTPRPRDPGRRGRAPVAALCAAALLAGCAAPFARARLRGELRDLDAARSLPAPSPFGDDAPGAVHAHTRLSHDSPGPLEELVAGAKAAGLRWVCLTEHTNPDAGRAQVRGRVDGVLLVPGQEISRWGGAVLALGASRTVEPERRDGGEKGYRELDAEIRALGGVPMWGHVTHFDRPPSWAPGAAIVDVSDEFRRMALLRLPAVSRILSSGDAGEAAAAYVLFVQRRPVEHLALWDRWLADAPCPGVVETNAHAKFRYLGRTFDPYDAVFRLARNHLLVRGPDEADVLDALAAGRNVVGFDALADATGARFEAWRGGVATAAPGGEADLLPGTTLALHLPLPARVRILRDGRAWFAGEGRVLYVPVTEPGVYRAEADLEAGGAARPWILANAIRFRAAPPQ